jgi:hypothetical protein
VSRCTCHHWAHWGDAGSTVTRSQCPNTAAIERDSDGRSTCMSCANCNPADSEGFSR